MISSHVLDISKGKPAAAIELELQYKDSESARWVSISTGKTNDDGRVSDLLSNQGKHSLSTGTYRIVFKTGPYLTSVHGQQEPFYPEITIAFQVGSHQTEQHFHIPLLLSPFGFSSYRGS